MSLRARSSAAAHPSGPRPAPTSDTNPQFVAFMSNGALICPHGVMLRSASPGKLTDFEESIFRSAEMSETPVVMAVTLALVEGARTVRP